MATRQSSEATRALSGRVGTATTAAASTNNNSNNDDRLVAVNPNTNRRRRDGSSLLSKNHNNNNIRYTLKVVLLGDSGVGKTSLALRQVRDEFHPFPEPTIGANCFTTRTLSLADGRRVSLRVWDTAGQERYQSLAPLYFRGAQAAILVYDRIQWHTWESLKKWVRELKQFGSDDTLLFICGNKCDLLQLTVMDIGSSHNKNEATSSGDSEPPFLRDVRAYAEQVGATYVETSAKDGTNVNELFLLVAQQAADRGLLVPDREEPASVDLASAPKSRCC